MTQGRVFLYAEFQNSTPFEGFDRRAANEAMASVPGLRNKTWLSGVGTHSIGGFYEFDSETDARACADGLFTDFAKGANASLTVKLFDGAVVAEASLEMRSPRFK